MSMAAWCTVASVAGGMLGYAIGALLYDSVGAWLIQLYGYGDKVEAFRAAYAQWGAWIILLKGLTPIPYKIVTITSGFAGYNFGLFVVFSIITRGRGFSCWPSCCTATASGPPYHRKATGTLGVCSAPPWSSSASWLRYT